jgi:hypothetical protein
MRQTAVKFRRGLYTINRLVRLSWTDPHSMITFLLILLLM